MIPHIYNDGGRRAAGFQGSAGDCVARAIAIVARRDYATVYAELAEINAKLRLTTARKRKHAAKARRSARNGIYMTAPFRRYMEGLGFRWVPTMRIGEGCKMHLDADEVPHGRIICRLSRHLTAVIDGIVHDTYNPAREKSYNFEPDRGQALKANQGRNQSGVWTEIGGRCVYGYWVFED